MSWFMDFLTDTARQAAPGIHQGINTDIQRKQRLDEMQKQIPIEVERQKAMMPGEIEKVDAIGRAAQARDAANQEAAYRRAVMLQNLKNSVKAQPPDDPIGRVLGGKYTLPNPNYSASEEAAGPMGQAPTENVGGLEWLRRARDVPSGHVADIKTDAKGTSVEWKPPSRSASQSGPLGPEGRGGESQTYIAFVQKNMDAGMPLPDARVKAYEDMTKVRVDRVGAETEKRGLTQHGGPVLDAKVGERGALTQKGIDVNTAPGNVEKQATKAGSIANAQTTSREEAKLNYLRLPAEASNRYALYKQVEKDVNRIEELFHPAFVGKGFQSAQAFAPLKQQFSKFEQDAKSGKYQSGALFGALREWVGSASPEEVEFRQAVADSANTILYARSGAQINEGEFQRLKGALFSLWDEPTVFLTRLHSVRGIVNNNISSILEAASTPIKKINQSRGGGQPESALTPSAQGAAPQNNDPLGIRR